MRQLIIGWLIGIFIANPYGYIFTSTPDNENPINKPANESSQEPAPKEASPKESVPSGTVQLTPEIEHRIQPGDTLVITVLEHPDFSRERTISPQGILSLPRIGELKVTNLTLSELEKMLTEKFATYIKNPTVMVELQSTPIPKPQRITILGEVAKPGNYEFPKEQEVKLLFLLGAVGGYTTSADLETVRLFRNNPSTQEQMEPIFINLKDILFNPAAKDIILQNNDILIFDSEKTPAQPQRITILGEIGKSGNYEFPKGQDVKLLFLLGMAGGYNQATGSETLVWIYRTNLISKEPEAPISIHLKDLLSNPSTKDIILQDKDVLVLESERIFAPGQFQRITILGEVAKPGNYEFPKGQEIKLLFLLGAAGGYTPSANLETARISRNSRTDPNQRAPILINLKEIVANPTTKDITLQDNDVLIIEPTPTSKWNTTIQKISPTLQVIGITLGIIWAVRSLQKD
ncbi:MAG: SLBB domain-containing protein [Planctomycetota bacterium]